MIGLYYATYAAGVPTQALTAHIQTVLDDLVGPFFMQFGIGAVLGGFILTITALTAVQWFRKG